MFVESDDFEINREFVLSTAHIEQATDTWLRDSRSESNLFAQEFDEGYRVLAAPGDPEICIDFSGIPGELVYLILLARKHNCKWLLLDCDGPEIKGLPVFIWS